MGISSTVSGLKTRCELIAAQGQEIVKTLPDTLHQANEVLRTGVVSLIQTESKSAKDVFGSLKAGFDKARADGVVAVVSNPGGYLPPAKRVASAFAETAALVGKTGGDLYKAFRSGLIAEGPEVTLKKAEVILKDATAPVIDVVEKAKTTVKKRTTTAKKKVSAAAKDAGL